MHLFITGGGGQLATDVAAYAQSLGDTVTLLARNDLDITNARAVTERIEAARPDCLVNCAAWTAVDACEDDPERAELVNGTAVGYLADAAARVGAHLVHISTDYVFDGAKAGPYHEADSTNPQSAYGRSKLLGEQLATDAATIVRTSWVCSAHGANMVATIARLAASHPELRFVADQRGRPSFTIDLATAIHHLAVDRVAGTFHVANHGEVSWFEFAQAVLTQAGMDPARVSPIATDDLDPPRPAQRPANSVLSTAKYEQLRYPPLRHFAEPLSEVLPAYFSNG